jgi:geranylgeranyl diphosphate synthase type II
MPEHAEEKTKGAGQSDSSAENKLPRKFKQLIAMVDKALERNLPQGEVYAEPVVEAIRYSLLAPGKRIRPVLAMLSAEIAGSDPGSVIEAAVAVEMIHTASLILDDLPCMDDSRLRRDRETLHRHTDEATAVLAADALLMQAFCLIGNAIAASRLSVREAGRLVQDAADCVGVPGMIGGQWKDLNPGESDFESLEYIHSHKTGHLFILSATLGARLSGANKQVVKCLASYAKNLGLAFQVTDDILNYESTPSVLGKDAGTDINKVTFVTTFGPDAARKVASELVQTAKASLEPFGAKGRFLFQLADFVLSRKK